MSKKNGSTSATSQQALSQQEWENICNHCGLCCFEKIRDNRGIIITTPIPCRYLDIYSRECKVYHKRFKVGEDCQQLTPELVARVDWLPEECAYVARQRQLERKNYRR